MGGPGIEEGTDTRISGDNWILETVEEGKEAVPEWTLSANNMHFY